MVPPVFQLVDQQEVIQDRIGAVEVAQPAIGPTVVANHGGAGRGNPCLRMCADDERAPRRAKQADRQNPINVTSLLAFAH